MVDKFRAHLSSKNFTTFNQALCNIVLKNDHSLCNSPPSTVTSNQSLGNWSATINPTFTESL